MLKRVGSTEIQHTHGGGCEGDLRCANRELEAAVGRGEWQQYLFLRFAELNELSCDADLVYRCLSWGDLSDLHIVVCPLCMVMWGCCRRSFVSRLPRPRGMVPAPSPYQDTTCRTHNRLTIFVETFSTTRRPPLLSCAPSGTSAVSGMGSGSGGGGDGDDDDGWRRLR